MTDLSTYGAYELTQTVAFDAWAVRVEAERRVDAIARKMAAAKAKIARLSAECSEMERIHAAALAQIRVEQAA